MSLVLICGRKWFQETGIKASSVRTALTPADGGGANLSHAKESNNNTLSDLEEKISLGPAEKSNCTSDRSDNGNNQIAPKVQDSRAGSFTDEQNLGETSFSMTDPVSSLISCLDPVAYSGSLSERSDSSTTSTGSFAFPMWGENYDLVHNSFLCFKGINLLCLSILSKMQIAGRVAK